MRRVVAASVVFAACAPASTSAPAEDLSRELQAQLRVVARPEPAGVIAVTSAARLRSPTRIARDGVWIEITPLDVPDVAMPARVNGVDFVHVATRGRFEELRRVHHAIARIELPYRVRLGAGIASLRVVSDFVEALDRNGVARLRTEPAFAVDVRGTIRALTPTLTQQGVTWSGDAADLVPPIAIDPAWTATKALSPALARAEAFPIPGKKVFVVDVIDGTRATQIYDDATASWTSGASMLRLRRPSRPVQLDDGRIFIAAGDATESPDLGEIYDPTTKTWKLTTASPFNYGLPVVTALKGTRALVIAPIGASVYDATANTWVATGAMITPRRAHTGVLLADGRALIIGGQDAAGLPLSTAEIYAPGTGTFSAAGSLAGVRFGITATTLADGRVLVTGGTDRSETGAIYSDAELFDPTTKTWTAAPKMLTARTGHSSVLLPDGKVLVAGGGSLVALLSSAELFDPTTKNWLPAGALTEPRQDFPMVPIVPGTARVIAIGGFNGGASATVDIFEPLSIGKSCTGAGECASLFCVDGVCCATNACAAEETCGGATAPGQCKKKQGTSCTTAGECGSGACVDGVCCDRACDGVCEACDLASSKGTCATLAPGDSPHGARGKCPGEGACAASCGGADAKSCTLFPGATTACGEPSCVAGAESIPSTCDGAGKCTAIAPKSCEPFACGQRACKRACAVDADCATGYSCDARSGKCVFGAKCDGDHTVVVPGSASIDCTPLKCAGASCLTKCASTSDCVAGTTCDPGSGACVVAGSGDSSDGGCAFGGSTSARSSWIVLMIAAVLLRRARAR
jgi:hypothetical protein